MRLVGNDKVPEAARPALRRLKAIRQGLDLRGGRWWPQLDGLDPAAREEVREIVRNALVWQATAPRYSADGRRIS